jgi:hypothetical protein
VKSCASCLSECRGVYCSDACKAADALCMVARGRCRCGREIEPERKARSRKTCATCCSKASVRTMAHYIARSKSGKCGRCGGKRVKPFATCAECRQENRAKGVGRVRVRRAA